MNADMAMTQAAMQKLDAYLLQALDGQNCRLQQQLRLTIASGGKRLRPMLVILSARLCEPELDTDYLLPLAAVVEMIHTASLIHDDILDDAELRRGCPSLHTRVGRHETVLYGDYLLAKALTLVEQYGEPRLYGLLARAVCDMCLGELQQLESAFELPKQSLAQYFQRIRRKTSSLIMACCQAGGIAGRAGDAAFLALGRYGEYMGLAFQLADDILDFAGSPALGKPRGQDLRQGLFTLPLLWALKHSPQADKLAACAQNPNKTEAELDFLLREVAKSGGLREAQRLVDCFSQKAAAAVAVFPDSAEKRALLALSGDLCCRQQ